MAFGPPDARTETLVTGSNGRAAWTFPKAFPAVPNVQAIAVVPSGGSANSYNVQIVSVSATAVTFQVNAFSNGVSLSGLLTLNLFSQSVSGVTIHARAEAP